MGYFSRAKASYYNLAELTHGKSSESSAPKYTSMCKLKGPKLQHQSQDVEMNPAAWAVPGASLIPSDDVDMKGAVRTDEEFIHALSRVLSIWVKRTASVNDALGRFHGSQIPSLSITDYLKRIRKNFFCSNECFVLALVYIDRASKAHESMKVCDTTVHRLLLAAVMLAAKFHDDFYYSNSHYAKVGGLILQEVNLLESTMLKILEWKLCLSKEEQELYHSLDLFVNRKN